MSAGLSKAWFSQPNANFDFRITFIHFSHCFILYSSSEVEQSQTPKTDLTVTEKSIFIQKYFYTKEIDHRFILNPYYAIVFINISFATTTAVTCNWCYCIALSHKDWELPNSRIWLAESDIDRGLDFPI